MTMFEVVSVPMIQLKTTTLKQEDDSFCQWATTNNMELNVKKTKKSIMSFLTLPPPPPIDPLSLSTMAISVLKQANVCMLYEP